MHVDRFCRKFEKIIDDNCAHQNDCEDCDFDQRYFEHRHRDRDFAHHRGHSNCIWVKVLTNPIFVGLVVGVIIALILLLMNRAVMA